MKTVIEMAREAGAIPIHKDYKQQALVGNENIERFAELVRADQDEKYKWDVHSCGPTCTNAVCVAIREAVEAEREACAKVCDDLHPGLSTTRVAEAIRARSNT